MTFNFTFKTAIAALKANKSRTALTILGIVIGITAIISVMSLGQGAQDLILGQIQGFGAKTIVIAPGRQPQGPTDFAFLFADSLKEKDLEALQRKNNVPHLAKIMPIIFGSESVSFEGETYRPTIFGVNNLFAQIYDLYPSEGRLFNEEEIKGYVDVAIIGSKVRDQLFGNAEALGQRMKIKGRNFRVIGILSQKGQLSFINFDDAVIIPYTSAQRYVFGIKHFHRIVVEADTEANVPATVEDIKTTLRTSHGITDPAKDDFFVETQVQALEQVSTITNVLTMFLAAVAAISLLVGGVGIMNIMLVSVTERTREIGLRKALGATERNILFQFLLEAVILTGLGGIAGIALGVFISFVTSVALSRTLSLDWSFVFPFSAAALGLGVAAAIGLVFGIYPARKAAKKDPIEALRYE